MYDSRDATSCDDSKKWPPVSDVVASSERCRNEGDARNADSSTSATSVAAPVAVSIARLLTIFSNRATSVVVSGRRNARRPNAMMVSFRQVVPSPVGSQAMKFLRRFASAMTCAAIASLAKKYWSQASAVRLPG